MDLSAHQKDEARLRRIEAQLHDMQAALGEGLPDDPAREQAAVAYMGAYVLRLQEGCSFQLSEDYKSARAALENTLAAAENPARRIRTFEVAIETAYREAPFEGVGR